MRGGDLITPNLLKVNLTLIIFIFQFLVFGIPITKAQCEDDVCEKSLEVVPVTKLSSIVESKTNIWLNWYVYILEFAASYLLAGLIIYSISMTTDI